MSGGERITFMDCADFVEARLAEREALANKTAETAGDDWHWDDSDPERTACDVTFQLMGDDRIILEDPYISRGETSVIPFVAANDPARVLRDVAAKRAILVLADEADTLDFLVEQDRGTGAEREHPVGEQIRAHLAQIWSDHPDYDLSWAPETAAAQ